MVLQTFVLVFATFVFHIWLKLIDFSKMLATPAAKYPDQYFWPNFEEKQCYLLDMHSVGQQEKGARYAPELRNYGRITAFPIFC
ncbi:unnamed protein product [Lathyrus sativus]|nr:unnamed protein product [Lathyrus sativus]